jgi:hypothetical protein
MDCTSSPTTEVNMFLDDIDIDKSSIDEVRYKCSTSETRSPLIIKHNMDIFEKLQLVDGVIKSGV